MIQFYSIHPSFHFSKNPPFVALSKSKKTPAQPSFQDLLKAKQNERKREEK